MMKKLKLKEWIPTEVHDWEGKENDVLVLNYTMKCALACDFCCYGCNPNRKEKMPFELAERLIREAAELDTFSSVGFTGGEPLLFPEEICALADVLDEVNLPFTIATAAHWAVDDAYSKELLGYLKNKGLIRLNISHDPSHMKFVDKAIVMNAVRAASELGIATYVVGTFNSIHESLESFLPEAIDLPKVSLLTKYVAKVGMAKKWDITQELYGLSLDTEDLCCYRRVNHDIVIWHDGSVYPCCSTFNRATPGIKVGNAHDLSLREIWEKIEGSLLFRIMKRQGFGELYSILHSRAPHLYTQLPQAQDVVGPCSLCNAIFKDKAMCSEVLQVISEYEKEKVSHALEIVVELLGINKATSVVEEIIT